MIKRVCFLIVVLFLTGCQVAMTTLKGNHNAETEQLTHVQSQRELSSEEESTENMSRPSEVADASAQNPPTRLKHLSQAEQLTQNLIERGNQELSGNRLVTPEEDNTNMYFQVALGRDPGNFYAIQGISKIVDLYTEWAWQAALNRQYSQASRYLDLARSVNSEDPVLLEMSSRIKDLRERRSVSNTASNAPQNSVSNDSTSTNDSQDTKGERQTPLEEGQFRLPKDLFSRSEEDIILQIQPIIDQVSALQSSIVIYWANDKEARLLYQIINSRVTEFRVRAMTYHRADYRVELQQD